MGGKAGAWKDYFTDPERLGMQELLQLLPKDEVTSLAKTTTGGLICTANVKAAISTIINFSDGVSLLNRRRITKEYLIKYLQGKEIPFSNQSDKTTLCRLVLNHWRVLQGKELKFNEYNEKHVADYAAQAPTTIEGTSGFRTKTFFGQHSSQPSSFSNPLNKTFPGQPSSPSLSFSNPLNTTFPAQPSSQSSSFTYPLKTISKSKHTTEESEEYQTPEEIQIGQQLAFDFAYWFYSRLNKLHDFIPMHFWNDCNFQMQFGTNNHFNETNIQHNGCEVYNLFRSLVEVHGCFFNPNTQKGIRGIINPHGLAQVMVSGTVHKGTTAVGVFEQVFGLVKDPTIYTTNNFKIKFSVLKMQEQGVIT